MKPENITYNLIKRGEAISLESDRAIDAKKDEILAEIDSKSIVNIKPFYKKYKTQKIKRNALILLCMLVMMKRYKNLEPN